MSDSDSATPSGEDAFPKSLASGSLSIGEKKVECHVLSDGRRVLDTSQAQAIFGAAKDRHFRRLLSRIPNASRYFKVRPSIEFRRLDGFVAHAYEGRFIMQVCVAYQATYQLFLPPLDRAK